MSNNKDAFLIDLVHPHLLPPYFVVVVVVFFLRYAVLLGRFMSCVFLWLLRESKQFGPNVLAMMSRKGMGL